MRWFYDLKTMGKLAVSFGVMVVMLAAVAGLCLSVASESNAGLEVTYHRDMAGLDLAERANTERVKLARAYLRAILEKEDDVRAERMREVDEHDATIHRLLEELDAITIRPDQKARLAEAKRLMAEYTPAVREGVRVMASDRDKGLTKVAAVGTLGTKMGVLFDEYAKIKKEMARDTYEQNKAAYARGRTIAIGIAAFAIVVAVGLAFIVGRAVAEPLKSAVGVLEQVSRGDLTVRLELERKDEVGLMAAALNRSLESVRSTLESVQNVSTEVSAASSELAASAQQISVGAQEQAASLEETAASLEEISSTVKQNTDNAQEASQLANSARDAAERGGQVVSSAVAAMSEITKSSKKIADIITTIDEIAFQTNLLALNAAVEAARAGEQGRGFGVVAAEVRSLAKRTGTAAKEIRGLIADSSSRVEVGTQQVNESGKTLEEIVRSVKRVTDMVAEIAAASREQNTGLDQVNTAVTQVDQVTQSNAAQTEELSATATSLSDKSSHLQSLVAAFDLGSGAQVGRGPSQPSSSVREAASPRPRPVQATSQVVRIGNKHAAPGRKVANGVEEF